MRHNPQYAAFCEACEMPSAKALCVIRRTAKGVHKRSRGEATLHVHVVIFSALRDDPASPSSFRFTLFALHLRSLHPGHGSTSKVHIPDLSQCLAHSIAARQEALCTSVHCRQPRSWIASAKPVDEAVHLPTFASSSRNSWKLPGHSWIDNTSGYLHLFMDKRVASNDL